MPELLYGHSALQFSLPDDLERTIIDSQGTSPLKDIHAAVLSQLKEPVDGSAPLKERISPGDSATVVASDITRAWVRNDLLIPPILDYLNECGITDDQITILVALGSHRKHQGEELQNLLGEEILRRCKVKEHDCFDAQATVYLGMSSAGNELRVNRLAKENDHLIITGGVVFHLMSGFGGGRKSVLPGISSYQTIQNNHRLLLDPSFQGRFSSALTKNNPLHEEMMEAARLLNPTFLINAVLGPEGIVKVVGGNWDSAWSIGCEYVSANFGIQIKKQADLVLASAGGFPKDINLYQSSKALDNAYHAVKPDGSIILVTECKDGGGSPDFFDWFDLPSLAAMEEQLQRNFTIPGYIAYHTRKLAQSCRVYLVSSLADSDVLKTGMTPVATIDEGIQKAHSSTTIKDCFILPHGGATLPILQK